MTDEDLYETAEAMIRLGGSFVAQLGRLLQLADPQNKARLIAAFPDYIHKYRVLAATRTGRKVLEL